LKKVPTKTKAAVPVNEEDTDPDDEAAVMALIMKHMDDPEHLENLLTKLVKNKK
jgi:mannitol/fructose-specific phosphotransferase system IIA component (Ntr-type)